ncbi:ELWxxDGT repeat protein [Hyalangium versicolor]|uniref:ELWxxDGT repeat protein n=1 Tax=Hyalangium versicolor TaxID=2861190 RepID=UPI001CCD3B09|nr:ELWxxDGT repeat protein [Hyalangium versicolor]
MRNIGHARRCLLWLTAIFFWVGGCSEQTVADLAPDLRGAKSSALKFQEPTLVRDLRQAASANTGSAPSELVAVGDTLFFVAQEASSGRELWKSDGTAAGTQLVRDIFPGTQGSSPTGLTAVGGLVFFSANSGSGGYELWRSDGTAEGTVLVKEIYPGPLSSSPANLTNVNGVLYFSATTPGEGPELWRSDGTAEGTVLVKDISPGTTGSSLKDFVAAGSLLFFSASTATTGSELWKSDGTNSGTVLVKEIAPSTTSGYVTGSLTSMGNRVFFVGFDPTARSSLWTSDGTDAGTRLVFDPTPGDPSDGVALKSLTAMGGTLFFVTTSKVAGSFTGYELWATDGSSTWLVKDINAGGANSWPEELVVAGNVLYFRASDAVGTELWKSDGTTAGTQRVSDIWVGTSSSVPQELTVLGGVLYFTAEDGSTGRELWKTDGTTAGTVRVKDIWSGSTGSTPTLLTATGTQLFLSADDGVSKLELWRSDGTTPGTSLVKDILQGSADSNPETLTVFQNKLWFTADVEGFDREIWVSDGTASGTQLFVDLLSSWPGSRPSFMVELNGALLFNPTDSTHGQELWKTDGTVAGTQLVKDIASGTRYSYPQYAQVVGGRLHFIADDGVTGLEPYVSDGTTTGTRLLKDIWQGSTSNSMNNGYVEFNGKVYFGATAGSGTTLWQTDGTTAGTSSMSTATPQLSYSAVTPSFFYFAGYGPSSTNDIELWRSDGTAAGTQLIKNIWPTGSSWPGDLALHDGVLYFSAAEGNTVRNLWRSDGTAAGTQQVKALPAGTGNFNPRYLTEVNGVLLFQATDAVGGTELWRSDGTTEGTWRVKDIHPGPGDSMANQRMLVLDPEGLVVFAASDGTSGMEPWVSDGTEAGTRRLADIAPGPYSSNPRQFTRMGDSLFFVANDGTAGFELWRISIDTWVDTTPPAVSCPASLEVEASSASGALVDYPPATVTDDASEPPIVSYSQASGTWFPLGSTTVTVTAQDAAGNTASCSFSVSVRDTTKPTIICPDVSVAEATSASGALVTYPLATASDAVSGSLQLAYSQASGTLFPLGTTDITVTAKDGAGNSTTCHFTLAVQDTTPPAVTCPPSITAEAQTAQGAAVTFSLATPVDDVTPAPEPSISHPSGTIFLLGTTSVTLMAQDEAANASSCTFTVTVQDTTPPTLVCPSEVTVDAQDSAGATITYPAASAHDLVTASPQLAYSEPSGSRFPLGTTSVRVTARDEAGLTTECAFPVTVRPIAIDPTPAPTDPGGCACTSGSPSQGSAGNSVWLLLLAGTAWLGQRSRRLSR